MKVKDVKLCVKVWHDEISIYDQDGNVVFSIRWGFGTGRRKPQVIAIANRLCDRFNAGQEVSDG